MGTRAFSHDSIFIPDGGAESEQTVQAVSQDNILGKVKTLQQQLGKNIKFGQPPPNAIPMKKADSGEASLEEDLFLTSPMEIVTQQDIILSDVENKSSDTPSSLSPLNLSGAGSEMEEKVAPVKPSRPKRHFSSAGTIESVNLDAIPLAIARLDNSAAKHKLAVKPKKQRVSKKHRRLALDQQNEQGGLESQLSLDQNGHPREDKQIWLEEEPEPVDSEEEKRRQEEYWQELEAKCKRQKAEAAERRRLEEQRQQALERRLWEENRRQELAEEEREEREGKEQEPSLEAEIRHPEEETRWCAELGGPDPEGREQEDKELLGAEEQLEELEAQRRQEEEERRLEEFRQQEREERERQEEEEKRMEELKKQEDLEAQKRQQEETETRTQEELRKQKEVEFQRRQDAEKKYQEALQRRSGERPLGPEGQMDPWSTLQKDFEEKPGEQENVKPKKQRESSEELSLAKELSPEAMPSIEQQGKKGHVHGEEHHSLPEKREEAKPEPPLNKEGQREEMLAPVEKRQTVTPEANRKVEELRWQEVDERQTMPRPYTFQVSSGGKQILFPKVNLSPVTPGKDTGLVSTPLEQKAHKASLASHALPSALSIPHTAILVTGAQLCGPAVNLNQIKDMACKSLLGLSEEKKHVDLPTVESLSRAPSDPRTTSGKTKPPHEHSSSGAAIAEWASIRSRILKNTEGDHRAERDQKLGDEVIPRGRCDSRGNLRKTPPVNAKFSIMPAWQKFSDGGMETSRQNVEAESIRKRSGPGPNEDTESPPPASGPQEPRKSPEKLGMHQEPTDTTEGCKFAKDLPSFLVPSLPSPPQKAVTHPVPVSTSESETTSGSRKPDHQVSGGEEKASPFGIKLRRTNYSLRFHCDQQTEQKKKKRHSSTGDNTEGGQLAPDSTSGETGKECVALKPGPPLNRERKQAPTTRKDSAETPSSHLPPVAQPGPMAPNSQTSAADDDKVANKMPLVQKPALAPKPTSQTPPSSPLSKLSRPYLVELLARRATKPDPEPSERAKESQETSDTWSPSPTPPEEKKAQKDEEEEAAERKPSSPALPEACQEKPSQTPEAGRKVEISDSAPPVPLVKEVTKRFSTPDAAPVSTEPAWLALAKRKAKAWSDCPQIIK
ncbi:PREDICTED: uncharacterized protein KIAA1211 homolog [Chrysochloris asiatica]|uniref:Uncharacterized protein KIAA1211 homolog n=1 Tax=Chrysochloris asiatica TaxID=185453 RepID=A0A9B0TWA5_CHRAS|nr:PREDICTED: uncharacterized protein KIAA1211 homolog [Chrysochloris asiatica]